jgi:hypothetical protein
MACLEPTLHAVVHGMNFSLHGMAIFLFTMYRS